MSRKLEDLLPPVAAAAARAIADLKARGTQVVVTSTLHSKEQEALYAQGREPRGGEREASQGWNVHKLVESENKYTVTNADGIKHKSNHQSGKALDVVRLKEGIRCGRDRLF